MHKIFRTAKIRVSWGIGKREIQAIKRAEAQVQKVLQPQYALKHIFQDPERKMKVRPDLQSAKMRLFQGVYCFSMGKAEHTKLKPGVQVFDLLQAKRAQETPRVDLRGGTAPLKPRLCKAENKWEMSTER